jgi:hypothetical protein
MLLAKFGRDIHDVRCIVRLPAFSCPWLMYNFLSRPLRSQLPKPKLAELFLIDRCWRVKPPSQGACTRSLLGST